MSSPPNRLLTIQIKLPSSHPQLLEGLDAWLRLGLISDTQVRQICREYLVCSVEFLEPEPQREVITARPLEKPLIALLPEIPKKVAEPSFIAKMFQSLGAELSVRWLLFLGVFLVVISSGVLAASQWEKFPASGQYGVLFAYTLSFWGFSFWAARQENLRLTAQTLVIVTLLLVPVNFWAMDSFGLWQNYWDWLTIAIACSTLTFITVLLYKNQTVINNLPTGKLPLINIVALSYLHWGWKLPGFPLIAVYLAMVGTTIMTISRNRRWENQNEQRNGLIVNLFSTVIISALVMLLSRAIFIAGVEVTQLGLAIGICGWLVTWLVEQGEDTDSPLPTLFWERVGGILLFLGWLVAVIDYPSQAIALSGLALWFVYRRLQRYSFPGDFAGIFCIGLQTIWLGWRLVPSGLQSWVIATSTQLTNAQNQPWALLSLALFPYIILMLALTDSLYRAEKRELAKFGELLILLFATCLTTIATINPTLRSLNLLFSTITLAVVIKRRSSTATPLIYLTHVMGVLTLCSGINWLLPNLSLYIWASILLVLMIAEWIFSLGNGIWQTSAWYIGLGFAIVSFALLWVNIQSSWRGGVISQNYWGVIWLITPLALTGLASRTRRTTNSFLSLFAVGTAQLLTLPLPGTRLIGLAVAAIVMFANTRYLRSQEVAGITIGFGLSFIGALLWEVLHPAIAGWFIIGAIAILSLWLTRAALIRRGDELAVIYAAASDKWAIALCSAELLSMTLHSTLVYQGVVTPGLFYLAATAIALGAIIYRSWRESTNWAFYGIGWCLELSIAELLGFGEHSTIKIAIANIALGLITQLLGEWWRRRYQLANLPSSFHILPLIYGVFSVALRLNTFTGWTGLCTLGVALIIIGVGRRNDNFKPLLYLGIIGVSISAYELLFYQMLQASGGGLGDGLIAMSALGASIMYAYRIFSPWLLGYLRLTPQELKRIAHLHWAWSSCLLIGAISLPIGMNRFVGLTTGAFLIRYAIFQGRHSPTLFPTAWGIKIDKIWVYLGLLEAGIIGIFLQDLPVGRLFAQQLLPWNGAIACVAAYFLYILPWESWGWSKRPWQRAAYILPLIILWQTAWQVYPITLLIASGFYIFLAKVSQNIRFTYISVALIDWALCRWFSDIRLTDALWYVTPMGLSLLYVAQIDPQLQLPQYKAARHSLRLLGSGVICGWAILFHQNTPLTPGIFSLIAIFAGLGLRVRAFLYIGTATFFITSIYQLVIFSLRYPFLKWIIGLLVGIALISIAANFETRRAQITSLVRNATDEFQKWE